VVYNSDIFCPVPADLRLPHPYGIVIHSSTRIGSSVTIMQQVTIGGVHDYAQSRRAQRGAIIGNDVFIGAGAKIIGDVTLGDGVVVGANAVVTKDVPPRCVCVGFNDVRPAKQRVE
jgi:serine O-acetyltransferase